MTKTIKKVVHVGFTVKEVFRESLKAFIVAAQQHGSRTAKSLCYSTHYHMLGDFLRPVPTSIFASLWLIFLLLT